MLPLTSPLWDHAAITEAKPLFDPSHVALAKALYAMRGYRPEIMPSALFGEPGWDVLLDLYISGAEGRRLSITSLCIGSHTSITTGLRYIRMLEKDGLATREPDDEDGRRWFVELTQAGRSSVDKVLSRFRSEINGSGFSG